MQLLKLSSNSNKLIYKSNLSLREIVKLKPRLIRQYYIKIFDTTYLHFISQRQQRDLLLANELYRYIISNCQINKKILNDMHFVNSCITFNCMNNSIMAGNIGIFNGIAETNANLLKNDMIALKTLDKMRIDMNIFNGKQDDDITKSIEAKLNKVAIICDKSFLDTITKNRTLQKHLINKLPKVIAFKQAKADSTKLDEILHHLPNIL